MSEKTGKLQRRGSVLLVDDNESVRVTLQVALEEQFDVVTAANASEARRLVHARPFDVVVTDFQMPGETGAELLEYVRASFPNTVGILMTGEIRSGRVRLLTSKATEDARVLVLYKPIEAEDLAKWVQNGVAMARLARARTGGDVDPTPATGVRHHKPGILIVDDDPLVADRLHQLLDDRFHVVATDDWGAVVGLVTKERCDLILMDVNMPVLKGDTLVAILKANPARKGAGPKIVLYSSHDESKLSVLATKSGADGYLTKSLRGPDLMKAIEGFLESPR